MARYDKYDPKSGGTRAPLAADLAKNSAGNPVGVGLNANGRVVVGAGNTGIRGILTITENKKAGDIVDVMDSGDVVEFVGVAGTTYTANTTTGVISNAAASATQINVGYTVEATRLVVRVARS